MTNNADYEDRDGSFISLLNKSQGFLPNEPRFDKEDIIQATIVPPKHGLSTSSLNCVFLGTSGGDVSDSTVESILSWFTESDLSTLPAHQVFVMGIDTETGKNGGVSLIQLCVFCGKNKPWKVVVATSKSGSFPKIARLLSGKYRKVRPICAGAEVYGDVLMMGAIDIKIFAALDISSANNTTQCIGLRQMLDNEIGTEWVKDKAVTCSDWDNLPLNLPQLKYAALDAWASQVLGGRMLVKMYPDCFDSGSGCPLDSLMAEAEAHLMTSLTLPKALCVALNAKMTDIQGFIDASRSHFEVPFEKIGVDHEKKLQTRISLQSFQKRLRFRYKVEAKVGKKEFNGVVKKCTGCLCFVEWKTLDDAQFIAASGRAAKLSSNNFNEIDKTAMSAKYALYHFISHFKPPPLLLDGVANRPNHDTALVSEVFDNKLLPRVVLKLLRDKSTSIGIALGLIFDAKNFLQEQIRTTTLDTQRLDLRQFRLNTSQRGAVQNAIDCRVSLVRGPPGTGKTSTIASFAGLWTGDSACRIAPNGRNRVLVLAPANASTLRVLESVVAAGLRSVALVVSSDWMVEWHQDSVLSHLHPFVVTPHVLDHVRQKDRKRNGEYADGLEGDLNDRALTEPACKWDASMNGQTDEIPDVMIMTHSFFSLLESDSSGQSDSTAKKQGGGSKLDKKKSMFRKNVSELLSQNTINAVVVDECSQLWEGHAVALFSKFNVATRFMLVGDDKQLPPFGSVTVKKGTTYPTRSLFEATYAAHPIVPCTQLNVSYRLPLPVGQVVSSALYQNELTVVRNRARDAVVRSRFQEGSSRLINEASCREACQIIQHTQLQQILEKNKSLVWINVKGTRSKVGTSPENVEEAEIASKLACGLLQIIRSGEAAEGIQGGYAVDTTVSWGNSNEEENDDEEGCESFGSTHEDTPCKVPLARDMDMVESDEDDDTVAPTLSSYVNTFEAEEEAVKKSKQRLSSTNDRMRLNVITPYEGQRGTIEKNLCNKVSRAESEDLARWVRSSRTVGNVDGLQGQEADVTIISPVRAPNEHGNGIGFLSDNRRLNVMLTRVQQLIIIVGDVENWANAPIDSLLRSFALKALDEGACFQFNKLNGTLEPSLPAPALPVDQLQLWMKPLPANTDSPPPTSNRSGHNAKLSFRKTASSVSPNLMPETDNTGKTRTQRRRERRDRQRSRLNAPSSHSAQASTHTSGSTSDVATQIRSKYKQQLHRGGGVRGPIIFRMPHHARDWSTQNECRSYCKRNGFQVKWSNTLWSITNS